MKYRIELDKECTSIRVLGFWYDRVIRKNGKESIFMKKDLSKGKK